MHNVSVLTHGIRRRPSARTAQVGLAKVRAGSHRHRAAWCNVVAPRPSSAIGGQFTERPLGADRPRWYVPRADPFPGTRGRTERETAPVRRARRVEGHWHVPRSLSRLALGSSIAVMTVAPGRRRRGGHCAAVESFGEHGTSGRAPLHAHPGRRHQHGVHRLRAAQHQLRPVARGARPDGPAERLRRPTRCPCSS